MDFYAKNNTYEDMCDEFEVTKITRSLENNKTGEKIVIVANDHNVGIRQFEIPANAIVSTSKDIMVELANNRIVLPTWCEASVRNYIVNGYLDCKRNKKIEYSHSGLGWYDHQGTKVYLYDRNTINGITSVSNRDSFKFSKGSKEEYRKFLNEKIYTHSNLALGMAIGYSAVVFSFFKDVYDLGETTIINLCGASSTGKTTVSQLLVSPFGCPNVANNNTLVRTFHSTNNAIYSALEGIHGIPMVLDDITTTPNINAANLIYTLASGEEKSRCTVEGALKDSGAGWSGLIVISSETPIEESTSENQGLKVRVIQTQGITWTPDAKISEEIKAFVKNHYGHTGIDFANYVSSIPMDELKSRYENVKVKVHGMMTERDNLSDRLESKYTAIALTIELMNECFALKLDMEKLIKILIEPEQNAVADRDISKRALEHIKNFVIEKKKHFLSKDTRYSRIENSISPIGDDYGSIVLNKTHTDVYISTTKVDEILRSNAINEVTTVKARWKEKGITKCDAERYDCKHLKRRCIHFIFSDKSIIKDYENAETKVAEEFLPPEPPVCTLQYDDSAAVDAIFGLI